MERAVASAIKFSQKFMVQNPVSSFFTLAWRERKHLKLRKGKEKHFQLSPSIISNTQLHPQIKEEKKREKFSP
jgi:hypothetical protein